MIIFGTFANAKYLPQLLSMLESFQNNVLSSRIAVVALDTDTSDSVSRMNFPCVDVYSVEDVETHVPQLATARENRRLSEYFFTLTSALPNFLFKVYPRHDFVVYIDADLFFFDNPERCILTLDEKDNVLLTSHNFARKNLDLKVYGEFNTGFVAFRKSSDGIKVASWWLERCLEWCKDVVEYGKFADQKYLENFSSIIPGVKMSQDFGLNLGPWGLNSLKQITSRNGSIYVNNQLLFAFHFSGLQYNRLFAILGLRSYQHRVSKTVYELIYIPYLRCIRRWETDLLNYNLATSFGSGLKSIRPSRKVTFGVLVRSLLGGDLKFWKGIDHDTNK
jgi:hypothetical protein